ncbi:hypothetical protein GOBAR_AA03425 [Gossypium barbadense]|uniref:Uncharacterized protein n=1 Tax=Gossypium barbadense TaxID=3634 RepID=A0A2P5YNJ0_GOSBA|nr:hypothetical protein GOBAR_AA03425 [Gossypium barbadense]
MVSKAPAHTSTKVPMLLEAPAHPRHQGADGAQGSRTTKVADGARGSRTTRGLGCRWCPRLPHDQGPRLPMVSEAPAYPSHQGADAARGSCTTNVLGVQVVRPRLQHVQAAMGGCFGTIDVLGYQWCLMLRRDQGPKVPEVLVPKGEGPGWFEKGGTGTTCSIIFIFQNGSPEHRRESSLDHHRNGSLATFMCLKQGYFMVPTLLHQREPKISFDARPSRTSDAPRCRCCPMLRHIKGAGGARWPCTTGWHTLPIVYEATARPGAKGAGGSCCKRGGTWMIHSLLGTGHATIFESYLWDDSFIIGDRFQMSEIGTLFSAQRSCTSEAPRCRCCSMTRTMGWPPLRILPQTPKIEQVPEPPTVESSHSHHHDPRYATVSRGGGTANKATLPLTIPRRVFKSSAKDFTHRSVGITLQGGTRDLSAAIAAPMTRAIGGQRPLMRVGNWATGPCIASIPDSDLEAFSYNPAHGRADIEGSKSNVAMNAWLPQASYPCGNFSDTSSFKFRRSKGSIGHAFTPNASAPTGAEVVDGARGSRTSEAPSKATLPLTIPRRVFKSSAKDSTRRSVGITLQGGARDLSAAAAAPTTRALGGQRPLLRVGNRATGACVASSPDSDLEAFSHNPAHGSFAPLAFQPSAMTNCANQRSESTVRRPGKAPEGVIPSPSPDQHAVTCSRRGSSSSSAPVADEFGTGTPVRSPQSQSFSRGYGSIFPTSLAYIVPLTRGCSPWRPDAVMNISTATVMARGRCGSFSRDTRQWLRRGTYGGHRKVAGAGKRLFRPLGVQNRAPLRCLRRKAPRLRVPKRLASSRGSLTFSPLFPPQLNVLVSSSRSAFQPESLGCRYGHLPAAIDSGAEKRGPGREASRSSRSSNAQSGVISSHALYPSHAALPPSVKPSGSAPAINAASRTSLKGSCSLTPGGAASPAGREHTSQLAAGCRPMLLVVTIRCSTGLDLGLCHFEIHHSAGSCTCPLKTPRKRSRRIRN